MLLNVTRFNDAIESAGVTSDVLAAAVDREGIDALSAIRNWRQGNFKPRPTPDDLRALAGALGVQVVDIVRFDSAHRFARISPRKARLVADMIRGKEIDEALSTLRFSKQRAAMLFRKVLDSAIADADQSDADITSLVVSEARVDEGPRMKRFRPKDRGRAHGYKHRMSHLIVAVEEEAL